MANWRLHFQDDGQDFLWWNVNSKGVVTSCEPFQSSIWNGKVVQNLEELVKDKCGVVTILNGKEPMSIIHLVEKVESI
jgi:hypothetical protein